MFRVLPKPGDRTEELMRLAHASLKHVLASTNHPSWRVCPLDTHHLLYRV